MEFWGLLSNYIEFFCFVPFFASPVPFAKCYQTAEETLARTAVFMIMNLKRLMIEY